MLLYYKTLPPPPPPPGQTFNEITTGWCLGSKYENDACGSGATFCLGGTIAGEGGSGVGSISASDSFELSTAASDTGHFTPGGRTGTGGGGWIERREDIIIMGDGKGKILLIKMIQHEQNIK